MPPRSRPARLPGAWLSFLGSVGLLGALVALLAWDPTAWFAPRLWRSRWCGAGRTG